MNLCDRGTMIRQHAFFDRGADVDSRSRAVMIGATEEAG
jgi:hypothetical protein